MPAPDPDSRSLWERALPRDARWEIALGALGLAACYGFGLATGWMGRPRTLDSTVFWPFYTDTWFPAVVLTGRILLPILAFLLVWPLLRRWLDDRDANPLPLLCGLILGAWAFHLSLGFVRHGVEAGLTFTFRRPQEYWNDVPWLNATFLASFPEIGRPLSQHGATHPPGIILVLGLVKALGFTSAVDAEMVCTPLAALTAFPLWGAAKRLTDEQTARMTVPLFLFACSVSAFAVLCMDVVTMLLGAVALYGFSRILDGEWQGGVILGLALAAASLCSFLALTLPIGFCVLLWQRRSRLDRGVLRALLLSVAIFLLVYLLLWLIFGYRPLHVFSACLAALQGNEAEHRARFRSLVRAPLTFWGALGIPLAALTVRSTAGAIRRLAKRTLDPAAWLILAATLPWLLPVITGHPRAELEHILLLFVPITAMAAAYAARSWYQRDLLWLGRVAVTIAVLQSIAVEVLVETYW